MDDKTNGDDFAESVRTTMYESYHHEIDAIWRNSQFAWTFEALIFGACGVLASDYFKCPSSEWFYYIISLLIILGLCSSAIWIALAKGSKTWQEYYEGRISKLEQDRNYFHLPREYAMGGTTNRIPSIDSSLLSLKSGKFSLGRINIFISQLVWLVWAVFFIFIQVFTFWEQDFCNIQILTVLLTIGFYVVFIAVMKKKVGSEYLRNEDYKDEYIFETYVQLENAIHNLKKINNLNKDSLCDFIFNEYCALSWPLYNIEKAQCSDDIDWYQMSFEELKKNVVDSYIEGTLDSNLTEYKDEIDNELNYWRKKLQEYYQKERKKTLNKRV